jgi:hypothetical protein
MESLSGGILENEKVQKTSRIIFLLPSKVHVSARFIGLYISNELFDGLLDFVHR